MLDLCLLFCGLQWQRQCGTILISWGRLAQTDRNIETPSQPQQFFSELPHGATASFTSSSEDTMESYRNHIIPICFCNSVRNHFKISCTKLKLKIPQLMEMYTCMTSNDLIPTNTMARIYSPKKVTKNHLLDVLERNNSGHIILENTPYITLWISHLENCLAQDTLWNLWTLTFLYTKFI